MHLTRLARVLFLTGLGGLGLLSLIYGDFGMNWQPVPAGWHPVVAGVSLRLVAAYLSGAILLAGGLGLLVPALATRAAALLTGFVFLWLVVLQVPRVVGEPGAAYQWLGFGENLLLAAGGWTLRIALARRGGHQPRDFLANATGLRTARLLFAISLPLIGYSHFVYTDATAGMIPKWIPGPRFFAYLTGAGHIAAGAGLLLGILPRLAATMEAAMISAFILLLHAPALAAAPGDRLQWTMCCVAMAYAGAAWANAASYAGESWAGITWLAPRTAPAA